MLDERFCSLDNNTGWCYINNAALAAVRLSEYDPLSKQYTDKRKVAILDIDCMVFQWQFLVKIPLTKKIDHHGNGTQDIFYNSNRILYVSIHADPDDASVLMLQQFASNYLKYREVNRILWALKKNEELAMDQIITEISHYQ